MDSVMNSVGGNAADFSFCHICKDDDGHNRGQLDGRSLVKTSCTPECTTKKIDDEQQKLTSLDQRECDHHGEIPLLIADRQRHTDYLQMLTEAGGNISDVMTTAAQEGKAESEISLPRCFAQPNTDTPDDTSSAAACFEGKSVSNKHLSETLVTTAGIDKEAAPESSLMTRMMNTLSRLSIITSPSHEKTQLLQEREATTLAQLEAIMTGEAFKDFQEKRGKTTSKGFPETFFGMWYNQNKSNPDLQQILTEQKDTDAVKALKSQIVQYEMGALEQLKSMQDRRRTGSHNENIPQCLKLKAKDLFDKHNNYLIPNPKLEVNDDEIEEVLGWYCQGMEVRQVLGYHVRCNTTLENTYYSETEIARKLGKFVAVREQRAVDALKKLMPDEAFKVFQTFMEEKSTIELKIKSGNPLVDWYNSCADNDSEFLKPWWNDFLKTKAWETYRTFLAKYENHAKQKFKEIMGEDVYSACYLQLPHLLPRDLSAKNNNAPIDYHPRESSFFNNSLEVVKSWIKSLSDDQLQQLSKGEARNSYNMDWLKIVTRLFGEECYRRVVVDVPAPVDSSG